MGAIKREEYRTTNYYNNAAIFNSKVMYVASTILVLSLPPAATMAAANDCIPCASTSLLTFLIGIFFVLLTTHLHLVESYQQGVLTKASHRPRLMVCQKQRCPRQIL